MAHGNGNGLSKELFVRAQNGDEKAYDELYDSVFNYASNVAFQRFGYKLSPEEVEDIAQIATIKVHDKIGSYSAENAPSSWVYRIVTNVGIDHMRKENCRGPLVSIDDVEPGVESDIFKVLAAEDIIDVIKTLPEKQREIIQMRVLDGYEFRDIAEMTGANNIAAARWYYWNAMGKLRKKLRTIDRYVTTLK